MTIEQRALPNVGMPPYAPRELSTPRLEETPSTIEFEGVRIQWDKGSWSFTTPDGKRTQKDTYSIWNPTHWKDISRRIASGQTCAMQIGGAYGAGMLFETTEWLQTKDERAQFNRMATIKEGRPWKNNYVALVDPEQQGDVIDFDRIHPRFKDWRHNPNQNLRDPNVRFKAHGWAQHNIYPVKMTLGIDKGLINTDNNSMSCFWINGHWGFEGIINEMRKIRKHGFFGGGSLNFHGETPGFSADDLKKMMQEKPSWLENIDFILFDEFAESERINRSQPMVSFVGDRPRLIRHGSMSVDEIQRRTGFTIHVDPETVKYASSDTEYTPENNYTVDQKIMRAEWKIQRFKHWLNDLKAA